MSKKITIFWLRQDLRVADNPGLFEAAEKGVVMPVYIHDEKTSKLGKASRWWLQRSLESLNKDLSNKLNIYVGNSEQVLTRIAKEHNIGAVYWSRRYEDWCMREDERIAKLLQNMGIECKSFNASLLWDPEKILKDDGSPYKVYTPFYRRCSKVSQSREPLPRPDKLELIKAPDSMESLPIATGENFNWKVGEGAARERLLEFLDDGLWRYKEGRNYPDRNNTSRLSPHLHFGEISPNQVWQSAVTKGMLENWQEDLDCFLSELAWREFSYYLLYHFPKLPVDNYQPKFDNFPWQYNEALLKAWQAGQTGYPIVDAGMRELAQTGYMHNRVRMVVASFLVKNLLIHWHQGADWFLEHLVDADIANNSASWQWVAGSGADAAPYFRIFNPTTQGKKFDPNGHYTRRFIPELAGLPTSLLFEPWKASADVLRAAGITLGESYPRPIVDINKSRERALMAYRTL